MRGADIVDEHQVAGLQRLTCSVGLVDLVDHLHDVLADRIAVAEVGVERQPVGAVDLYQVLAHFGVYRPLVEKGNLVEPAALAGDRVMHNGAAVLPGAQSTIGLPLELDRVGMAIGFDGATVMNADAGASWNAVTMSFSWEDIRELGDPTIDAEAALAAVAPALEKAGTAMNSLDNVLQPDSQLHFRTIRMADELIETAGGDTVFPHLRTAALARDRIVDADEVRTQRPDVILASWCGKRVRKRTIRDRPGWTTIPAVRDGHVHEIKSSYILQPGPAALTEGVRQVHALLCAAVGVAPPPDLSPLEGLDRGVLS